MVVTDLSMVIIYVSSVKDGQMWYRDVLGLYPESDFGNFAVMKAGEFRVGLHEGKKPGGLQDNEHSMPVFAVDDYDAAKQLLESKDCKFFFENETPANRFGSFADPDGNAVQIMQALNR
jgi:catechol 2,3-dioxygenase-like lactoylglutathione lyase family enzyme